MLLQKCYCLLTGDAVIEFDAEYAFFKFTVMNDSDVLNAECIRSEDGRNGGCLLYTSPSPRDVEESRMPSSA